MYEGALTEKECLEALKDMGTEKTPGTNGLPAEFYKVFWKILPSLHNRTHSKVEAWGRWSARPKICLIVTISLQQSG